VRSGGGPAGFASRAAALITDAVVLGVSHALVSWTIVQIAALLVSPRFGDRLAPWVVSLGGTLLGVGYNVVSWSAFGKTPGKAIFGLEVVTLTGRRPSVLRSLVRFLGYVLSLIPLGAGFLWVLVDDHRRAWHDHLAGTTVEYRAGARARAEERPAAEAAATRSS
jgi:uncharacterized RDD family membrane protein YckC